jgi:hypothetical protein
MPSTEAAQDSPSAIGRLSLAEVKERKSHYIRTAAVWFGIGVVLAFAYLSLGAMLLALTPYRWLAPFPAFPLFLIPACIGERKAARYAVLCESCRKDVVKYADAVCATGECPNCGHSIIEDHRGITPERWKADQARDAHRFLLRWLWTFPLLAACCLVLELAQPGTFESCPLATFTSALLGFSCAGWVAIRTQERRVMHQLIFSMCELVAAIYLLPTNW